MNADLDMMLPVKGLTPTDEQASHFRDAEIQTSMGPAYAHSLIVPRDWREVKGDGESVSAPNSTEFTALSVLSPFEPPIPPVMVSVGVKVAPKQTTLAESLRHYCQENDYEIIALRPQRYVCGVVVEALARAADPTFGEFQMRLAVCEDGGRLFGLCGMAPTLLYPDFVRCLSLAMMSFQLLAPLSRGPVE